MIIKLLNGNILQMSKEESDYLIWSKLSPELKRQIRTNKAKAYLNAGPNISNLWNAFQSYIGNNDPKNPHLNTGEAPSPGWGKQGVTGLHKMMAKLPEAKLVLMAPLAGRSRAAATLKMEDIVKAQLHRDEVYKRWTSLYKLLYDPTPTTFRTKPARVRRLETDISKTNGRTLAGGKGHAGGSYNHKSHTINVTTSKTVSAKNLEDIGFHEGIHSYGLGESPSYLWKTRYLNFPEGTNPYSLDPREIATHGIQQGQNLGIKVGQSYPGKEAMIKMIENRPDGVGFGGIPYTLYNNAKTNADYRRLWSLLNGTFKDGGVIKAANARKWKHKEGGIIKAQEGTKFNWGELIKTVGGIASNAISTVSENKKLSALAKQNKLEKVNPLDYITKYLLEILENNLRSQQAARALGSTVNFNPDIDKHFAYLLTNQEVARKNSEIDKQNKLLDIQTENLKTSNWMNLFGNVALTGLEYLTSNIGKKSTNVNVPPSSTSTTANTATTSNFNNYINNITVQKQLGIV